MELGSVRVGVDVGDTSIHADLRDGSLIVAGTRRAITADVIAGPHELARDARVTDLDVPNGVITAKGPCRASAEWLHPLQLAQMPCAQVHRTDGLLADRHVGTLGMSRTLDHPAESKLRLPCFRSTIVVLAEQPDRAVPRLGANGAAISTQLGIGRAGPR